MRRRNNSLQTQGTKKLASMEQISPIQGTKIVSEEQIFSTQGTKILCLENKNHLLREQEIREQE
jgi:hypothetical protein